MRGRALLVVVALSLLLAPGCELLTIPLRIVDALASVLFFWARAPGPGDDQAPVPLSEALARAMDHGARGSAWLVPEGASLPEPGSPPFPGAVLRSTRVVEESLGPELLDRLRDRGIELRRAAAP